MDVAERMALTSFCAELPMLRAECARHSPAKLTLLADIEERAKAREPILPLLAALLGAPAGEVSRALGTALPGTGPGRADEESFGCPDGVCGRVEQVLPAGRVPSCRLDGRPMVRR
ncbi:hypothetical protein AB0M83_27050 [Amycolatopsis sp. NPDC051106]|uniref:hypothetical protein n=1 Tax=unclassified Amycolatopsis TaxID=2618356 RepID=UPI003422D3AB